MFLTKERLPWHQLHGTRGGLRCVGDLHMHPSHSIPNSSPPLQTENLERMEILKAHPEPGDLSMLTPGGGLARLHTNPSEQPLPGCCNFQANIKKQLGIGL